MPLIPGINDDAENLDAVAQFLLSHGVSELRVVPYHRLYVDKYRALGREPELAALQPPTDDVVQGLVRRMARHGVVVAVDG